MACESSEWIVPIYQWSAPFVVFLAIYVMNQTESSPRHADDAWWIHFVRSAGFILIGAMVVYAVYRRASQESLFLIYVAGANELGINALAIRLRPPPSKVSVEVVSREEHRTEIVDKFFPI